MIRLVPDISAQIERTEEVSFTFDGVAIRAYAGESIACALMRAGVLKLRKAPEDSAPRGAFCLMGLCQECVVLIDGRRVESCRTEALSGLAVTSLGPDIQ